MLVEWKHLLSENQIPGNRWPVEVREVKMDRATPDSDRRTMALITYPAGMPVTVLNASGKSEWNPELRDGLELIYNEYRRRLGKLCAPAWSRTENSVQFHSL